MQRIDIVIPTFWAPFEIIKNKLNPFLEMTPEEADIFIYAYCPPPEKSYVPEYDEVVNVKAEHEKSVVRWLAQLEDLIHSRVNKEHYIVVTNKDIAKYWRESKGAIHTSLLVLLLGEKTMLPLYRSIIRSTDIPVLALFSKNWKSPIEIVAAVDPFHDHDEDNQRDIRLVKKCKEISMILHGSVTILHCCQAPGYLSQYKKQIKDYRQHSIAEFAELNNFSSLNYAVLEGAPVSEIRNYVTNKKVDLLGVGSVSRGFLERYIMGSTADDLLSDPPCDLLLLRS